MPTVRIVMYTELSITVGLMLFLGTALHTASAVPENVFKLVSTGQSFVQTTSISPLQSLTKIICASICFANSCPGFCFNPRTKVCQVFIGPATWVPLTPVTDTRLYWNGGVLPTTTTSTIATTATTTITTTAPVPQPGFTYVFYNEFKDYKGAQDACNSRGGTLAAPMTPLKWEVFKNSVGYIHPLAHIRLWADDMDNEGDFRWGPNNVAVDFSTNWIFGGSPTDFAGKNLDCLKVIQKYFDSCSCIWATFSYSCEEPVADCQPTDKPICYVP